MQGEATYDAFIKGVFSRYYPLGEDTLTQLYELSEIKQLHAHEVLLPVGKTAQNIYILYRGSLIAYFLDKDGNTYNKNIFLEGDFVGSTVSYLTQSPSNFALEAVENSTLISFPYKAYRRLINTHTDLKDFYIAYLEQNWVIDKEKREIDIVMKDATSRYLELLGEHPDITERIPLNHIASHLGITPTQLSRIRKNMKK